MENRRAYLCIDLKTFYASVECADRGLDPFSANLVVADESRGRTTICLAITPALKKLGVRNRCRLFEIPEGIPYTAVVPRMSRYMEVSSDIYAIYLQFVSPEDIHIYSIDECFIDATPYLALYGKTAREFADMLMAEVLKRTGIRATAGIGSNLFLAKIALDITAKHDSGNIGMLDERSFKRDIWFHRPITDIWGIGPGIARRLERHGIHDLAGIAAANPDVLYREFGKNAEHLIEHGGGQGPGTKRAAAADSGGGGLQRCQPRRWRIAGSGGHSTAVVALSHRHEGAGYLLLWDQHDSDDVYERRLSRHAHGFHSQAGAAAL